MKGTEESIARYLNEEERDRELRCWTRHPDAGGFCGCPAEMAVYGLPFCGVHGAEIRAGTLSELFEDAADTIERLNNPYVPICNEEAAEVVVQTVYSLRERVRR